MWMLLLRRAMRGSIVVEDAMEGNDVVVEDTVEGDVVVKDAVEGDVAVMYCSAFPANCWSCSFCSWSWRFWCALRQRAIMRKCRVVCSSFVLPS